jgi:hypothetical protein
LLHADLPGISIPQGTIPDSILVTSAHPNIVIIEQQDVVTLFELTISHNSLDSMARANERKSEKELYQQAPSDLGIKAALGENFTP